MKIQAMTDTGLVRTNNEDAFWFDSGLQAMAIADGKTYLARLFEDGISG